MTVRIKTRKFIHNYAPNMESKVQFNASVDDDNVNMEVLDMATLQTAENAKIEEKIKWADAFILMYSVTDSASLADLVGEYIFVYYFVHINLHVKNHREKLTGNK